MGSDGVVALLWPEPRSPCCLRVCSLVHNPSGKLKGQFSPGKSRFQTGRFRDLGAFGLHMQHVQKKDYSVTWPPPECCWTCQLDQGRIETAFPTFFHRLSERPFLSAHGACWFVLVPRTGHCPALDKHNRPFPLPGVDYTPLPYPSCPIICNPLAPVLQCGGHPWHLAASHYALHM